MKTLAKLTPTQAAIKYLTITNDPLLQADYLAYLDNNLDFSTDHVSFKWMYQQKVLSLPLINVELL